MLNWELKNWCLRTVVLEKTVESPLDCKEINPVHSKGDHTWLFIGKTDAEAAASILWPPDAKNSLEKILMLGKIEGRRRRGCLVDITDSMDMSLSKLQEIVKDREAWRAAVHGVTKSQTQQSNWAIISTANVIIWVTSEVIRVSEYVSTETEVKEKRRCYTEVFAGRSRSHWPKNGGGS